MAKPTIDEMQRMLEQSGELGPKSTIQELFDHARRKETQGDISVQGYFLVSEDYVLVTAPGEDEIA